VAVAEETSQTLAPVTLPLLGSLLLTGAVAYLFCTLPARPSLTWLSLLGSAFLYVLLAAAVHALAVWAICRVFREHIEIPFRPLILGFWMSPAWLPLLVLLIKEHSICAAFVPPLISVFAVLFLMRWKSNVEKQAAAPDSGTLSLFHLQESPSLLRSVLPAALTSIALEAGAAALLLGYPLSAGGLFALCAVLLLWALPIRSRSEDAARRTQVSKRTLITGSLLVFLLTGVALIPFLRPGPLTEGLQRLKGLLRIPQVDAPGSHPKTNAKSQTYGGYSGFILILPPKPREKTVPPAPVNQNSFSSVRTAPTIIPFDGAYWYFKAPDHRPRDNARVVHGEPTKVNIHSTDLQELKMEAHQYLGNPIEMSCCRVLRLAIQNGDDRAGEISIEVLLTRTTGKESFTQSLGTLVVPSSEGKHITLGRPPVDETLNFPIPPSARGRQFDEITVAIKPSWERMLAGAHIAVQHFELVP
jgi:hypothetical protein